LLPQKNHPQISQITQIFLTLNRCKLWAEGLLEASGDLFLYPGGFKVNASVQRLAALLGSIGPKYINLR
jgi:hypothetical protein